MFIKDSHKSWRVFQLLICSFTYVEWIRITESQGGSGWKGPQWG